RLVAERIAARGNGRAFCGRRGGLPSTSDVFVCRGRSGVVVVDEQPVLQRVVDQTASEASGRNVPEVLPRARDAAETVVLCLGDLAFRVDDVRLTPVDIVVEERF